MRISTIALIVGVILVLSGAALASGAVSLQLAPYNGKPTIQAEYPSGGPTAPTEVNSLTISAWFEMFLPYNSVTGSAATVASYTINGIGASANELSSNSTGQFWNYSATITLKGTSGTVTFAWGASWIDNSGNVKAGGYSYITYWVLSSSTSGQTSTPPNYQASYPYGSVSAPTLLNSSGTISWIHMFIPSLSAITQMQINGMTVQPAQYDFNSQGTFDNYSQYLTLSSSGSVLFAWSYTYYSNGVQQTSSSSATYYYSVQSGSTGGNSNGNPQGYFLVAGYKTGMNFRGPTVLNVTSPVNIYFIVTANSSYISSINIYMAGQSSQGQWYQLTKQNNGSYYFQFSTSQKYTYSLDGYMNMTSGKYVQLTAVTLNFSSVPTYNAIIAYSLIILGAIALVVFAISRFMMHK